jgi:hypothetical protein
MKYITLLIACAAMSCSPIATFPPIETEAATKFGDATRKPVPRVMATVIKYAHEHYGWTDDVVFNLPKGVGQEAYALVNAMLSNATPMTSNDQSAYHIIELRVRGFNAEADVVYPARSGDYRMATLRLHTSAFDPWKVTYDRVWAVPIHESPSFTYPKDKVAEASNKIP